MVSTSVTVKAGHYCIPLLAVEVIIRAGNAKEHLIRYGTRLTASTLGLLLATNISVIFCM
jgi:hypothetical protein